MSPPELDQPPDVADGTVPGVKHAAIRKMEHELGIPPHQLPHDKFKFLTRFHYWAADTVTHGEKSPWGEHEIDYVLFFTIANKQELNLDNPNREEVNGVKWVSQQSLLEMMDDSSLLFSPWFRIIVNKWVIGSNGWWNDLKTTMNTDTFCDYEGISRFDPPKEHLGGLGDAGLMFGDGDGDKAVGDAS
jgi:isopentenyl-diphosphate delta-isomerase